ncbi:JmjC domain, hydroxylase-domain-containing protein [Stachybotrys elegans]|uniref:JmjC domain, hydroxylase-domain-containing protein n=1 Tax=Stachybotrys elegans TaxID=80388 RepID=A0A8K0SV67_9HYPO|nr:JmjC domain, hydroxylase-domain-containing protein [Stachybotrys elegans]
MTTAAVWDGEHMPIPTLHMSAQHPRDHIATNTDPPGCPALAAAAQPDEDRRQQAHTDDATPRAIPVSSLLDGTSPPIDDTKHRHPPEPQSANPGLPASNVQQITCPAAPSPEITRDIAAPLPANGVDLPPAPSEPPTLVYPVFPPSDAPVPAATANRPPTPSSPLTSVSSVSEQDEAVTPTAAGSDDTSHTSSSSANHFNLNVLQDADIAYDFDGPEGHQLLRLRPTAEQWGDFASILALARRAGTEQDGCFKVVLPGELLDELPERSSQKAPANAYRIHQIKRNGYWRVDTIPSVGTFIASEPTSEPLEDVDSAIKKLKKLFNKNKEKQLRNVRYRVDIPAWTQKQRELAGVPKNSPIHPLKGDKLDKTRAIIPGIHTPYVYESASHFGATFQIHAEDFRLASLNHLYKGRKIWIVVPCTDVKRAEEALGRKNKCSQFMRHRAEFFFPDKLDKLKVPYRIVDQRPGETIVVLPDAYHEGFSTGYTIAEAKNYAESDWDIEKYQACDSACQLMTAIPAEYMRLLREGETQLDLCARYGEDETEHETTHTLKRGPDEAGLGDNTKRIKV